MRAKMSKSEMAKRLRQEELAEISRKYRSVFSTQEGKFVLNHLIYSTCRLSMKGMGANMTPLAVYDTAARKDVANDILKTLRGPVDSGATGVADPTANMAEDDDGVLREHNSADFDDSLEG